ncbi:lactonase family protein [Cellulophaga baltica 4]|nr:lactonase family protein [Cellulophaga baltica 4]
MMFLKKYFLNVVFFLSQICFAQSTDDLMLYRKDIQSITGKNTVTITSYEKEGKHYIYAGGYGAIDVYALEVEGKLTAISRHELYKQTGPARGMVADAIGDSHFLFVANKHGNAIETFKIQANGTLERVSLVEDTNETHLGTAITLQVIHMKNASYLFIGGLEETPGLSSF